MKKRVQPFLVAGLGMLMLAVLFAFPTSVFAATANTPVGQLTATQGDCFDLGAQVKVSVSGGFANTAYIFRAVHANGPVVFGTDNTGSGSGLLYNVDADAGGMSGTATITATTSNNKVGVVTLNLTCTSGKG